MQILLLLLSLLYFLTRIILQILFLGQTCICDNYAYGFQRYWYLWNESYYTETLFSLMKVSSQYI